MRALTNEEMGQVAGGCYSRTRSYSCYSWYKTSCYTYTKPVCEPKPTCEPKPECTPVEEDFPD